LGSEVKPGSISPLAGICLGTVILQVDREEVKTGKQKNIGDKRILLLISDHGMSYFLVLNG